MPYLSDSPSPPLCCTEVLSPGEHTARLQRSEILEECEQGTNCCYTLQSVEKVMKKVRTFTQTQISDLGTFSKAKEAKWGSVNCGVTDGRSRANSWEVNLSCWYFSRRDSEPRLFMVPTWWFCQQEQTKYLEQMCSNNAIMLKSIKRIN